VGDTTTDMSFLAPGVQRTTRALDHCAEVRQKVLGAPSAFTFLVRGLMSRCFVHPSRPVTNNKVATDCMNNKKSASYQEED